jgi:hypothetical protein
MARPLPDLCYLCGKTLVAPVSADHVPPQQLFAPAIRKAHSPDLLTIPVHDACNKAYQFDEDYFVHTLVPFAPKTYAGRAIYTEILAKFRAGKKAGLTRGVLEEFDPRPSGMVLPGGKVLKRQNGARISRIAFKIVRGLYFHHHGVILPDTLAVSVDMTPLSQGELPPEHFLRFMEHSRVAHGKYPGVFSYRFENFADDPGEHNIHYWALLLWDCILLTVIFHDPACRRCQKPDAQENEPPPSKAVT